jgi:hypothetical protein
MCTRNSSDSVATARSTTPNMACPGRRPHEPKSTAGRDRSRRTCGSASVPSSTPDGRQKSVSGGGGDAAAACPRSVRGWSFADSARPPGPPYRSADVNHAALAEVEETVGLVLVLVASAGRVRHGPRGSCAKKRRTRPARPAQTPRFSNCASRNDERALGSEPGHLHTSQRPARATGTSGVHRCTMARGESAEARGAARRRHT